MEDRHANYRLAGLVELDDAFFRAPTERGKRVVVWFKQTFFSESLQKCEVKTIRRVVLKVPGNVIGSGRYQHIRLAPSPMLEVIVKVIQQRVREFVKRITPKIPEAA
jgi:hypothetical protein